MTNQVFESITIDIVIDGFGAIGEGLTSQAQAALLESFQLAANASDLASKLSISVPLVAVTGAKVISSHGADVYKISIAISSDDPNLVAKEVFSTAIGALVAAGATPLARVGLSFIPGAGLIISGVGGTLVGITAGATASYAVGEYWDDYIATSAAGKWAVAGGEGILQIKDLLGSGLGFGLSVTQGLGGNQSPPPSIVSSPSLSDFDFGQFGSFGGFNQAQNFDYQIRRLGERVGFGTDFFNDYGEWFSKTLIRNFVSEQTSPEFNYGLDVSGLRYTPIGAFYDSRSLATDTATSIAEKTQTLFDSNGRGLTAAQLLLRDANKDGQLSANELNGVTSWADTNENGQVDADEMRTLAQRGVVNIRASDYELFTQGNNQFGGTAAPPIRPSETSNRPAYVNRSRGGAPASNYQALRTSDEIFATVDGYFFWRADQVKVNYNNQNYLIGTDGDDSFNAQYYASSSRYININLLTHFLGGAGNDSVGGSGRDDSIWGGTGNDSLWGYGGYDSLYGEEGNDQLSGDDGDDYLDGGVGNDSLFGGTGDDVLMGGDGADYLYGESGNDVLYGESGIDVLVGGAGDDYLDGGYEDDQLHGQAGADTLVGGYGADQLFGGDGNDQLVGEAGNDRLFGQTGDDTLWGGAGDDLLVGFTASNETKQTLLFGETDNDTLYGGAGNDSLYGGLGDDVLDGGDHDDFLVGDEGNDRLFGGAGADELQGNAGDDLLMGEAGNDRLFGYVGNDVLWGGDGDDVLVGFSPTNDAKQSLSAGETDDDILYGGNGNDYALGGLGNDTLYGEAGNDDLEGGAGNDFLYGGDGMDRLFGQVGNDVLYGGDGDDLLMGFTASNEAKQTLNIGETDDDWLYGGAGNDRLVGGLGNDYLDGGAGADEMEGGQGDDTYVVNSVNDSILEFKGQGYDRVISSTTYLLNANIEELRLLEGFDIHGTGNALDNLLIGNSRDNILDGVTGADRMIGGAGNDTYFVDNLGDETVELANEGTDTVQASISHTLADNVENIILLDFSKAERGTIDGQASLVYGYPKANELDYMQGDAEPTFRGTCALTSIANLLSQADRPTTEGEVLRVAIDNNWAVQDPELPAYQRGGSNYVQQQAILNSYGIRNDLIVGYNEAGTANLLRSGRGVLQAVNAGALWDDPAYNDNGAINHMVTLTGVAYSETSGELLGFYIADSGREKVSDMTRFVGLEQFRRAANVAGGYAIYTLEPLKLWDEDINATGNAQDNLLVGNRGDNLLSGGAGNDTLEGQGGNDVLDGGLGADVMNGGSGNDRYIVENAGDRVMEMADGGLDQVDSSISYTLGAHVENLTLTGSAAINGTGNALANTLRGNAGNNVLNGGAGNDLMFGGAGNDRYIVDSVDDRVVELAGEGMDRVDTYVDYTLSDNVESLTLAGTRAINGTGNDQQNWIGGNAAGNVIDGKGGTDILTGEGGGDTYIFGRGYGHDTIIENDSDISSLDRVQFLDEIGLDQLWFRRYANNLDVTILGSSDKLTIRDWYVDESRQVEAFYTANGDALIAAKVNRLVEAMAAFAPPSSASSNLPPNYQAALEPVLAASWG